MFGWDQKARLLRESWTANALAEELYAMFGSQVPSDTNSPVQINLPKGTTVAPITITGVPDGTPIIATRRPDGTPGDTLGFSDGVPTVDGAPITGKGGGGVPVWG